MNVQRIHVPLNLTNPYVARMYSLFFRKFALKCCFQHNLSCTLNICTEFLHLLLDMSKMTWTCPILHPKSWVCNRFPAGLGLSHLSVLVTTFSWVLFFFSVMSFPADGIESAYKNNIDDVRDFLEAKYPENYLVVNVSPRTYRTEKLGDRVCAYIHVG